MFRVCVFWILGALQRGSLCFRGASVRKTPRLFEVKDRLQEHALRVEDVEKSKVSGFRMCSKVRRSCCVSLARHCIPSTTDA